MGSRVARCSPNDSNRTYTSLAWTGYGGRTTGQFNKVLSERLKPCSRSVVAMQSCWHFCVLGIVLTLQPTSPGKTYLLVKKEWDEVLKSAIIWVRKYHKNVYRMFPFGPHQPGHGYLKPFQDIWFCQGHLHTEQLFHCTVDKIAATECSPLLGLKHSFCAKNIYPWKQWCSCFALLQRRPPLEAGMLREKQRAASPTVTATDVGVAICNKTGLKL